MPQPKINSIIQYNKSGGLFSQETAPSGDSLALVIVYRAAGAEVRGRSCHPQSHWDSQKAVNVAPAMLVVGFLVIFYLLFRLDLRARPLHLRRVVLDFYGNLIDVQFIPLTENASHGVQIGRAHLKVSPVSLGRVSCHVPFHIRSGQPTRPFQKICKLTVSFLSSAVVKIGVIIGEGR